MSLRRSGAAGTSADHRPHRVPGLLMPLETHDQLHHPSLVHHHPDGLRRHLLPVLHLLRASRRSGDVDRGWRRPQPQPDPDRADQRAVRSRRSGRSCSSSTTGRTCCRATSASRSSRARASTRSSPTRRPTACGSRSGRSASRSLVGLSIGLYSAIRRYSFTDKLTTVGTAMLSAVPVFVLGFILQYMFAVYPNKHDWPEWMRLANVGHRGATYRGIVVPLLHPDRSRPVAISRPAGDHARVRVDCAGRANDARFDARDARLRLHAHRQGEGAQ